MKKTFLLLFCFITIFSYVSCTQTSVNPQITTPQSSVPTEPNSVEPPVEMNFPDWETAYIAQIEHGKDYRHGAAYALIYVDDNDIPELYVRGCDEADGDRIYTFQDGYVIEQSMYRIGGGRYIERSGRIVNHNGHMGYSYTAVYNLDEKGFAKAFEASSQEHVTFLENGEYYFTYEYSVEGKSASEDAYYAAIDAAFDFVNSIEIYPMAVPYYKIMQQITGDMERYPDGKG